METKSCPSGARTYTWRTGDQLAGVALRYGVSEQTIMDANPDLDFNQLTEGEVLCIPSRTPVCTNGTLYTVKQGDSIASIAGAFGVTAGQLMEKNPYIDPSELQVGAFICVPQTRVIEEEQPAQPLMPQQPARPVPPRPLCPAGYTPGTVRYGDTYGGILISGNVSDQAFRLANPELNTLRLLPGQRYCLPPMGTRRLCQSGAMSYIMEEGQTLGSVANSNNITRTALLQLNPELAPSDFIPGRVICIPVK